MNFKKTALNFRGQGLTEFPTEVFNEKRVFKLNLSNNQLTSIPADITKLRHLETLDLSNNRIRILHGKLFELPRLKILILNNNRIISIPKQIQKSKLLKLLHLANNQLEELPPEIANLETLRELNLTANNLRDLPLYIGSFPGLRIIWLAQNPLSELTNDRLLNGMKNLQTAYFYGYKDSYKIQSKDERLKLAAQRPGNRILALRGNFDIVEAPDGSLHALSHPDMDERIIYEPPKISDAIPEIKIEQKSKSKIFISYAHYDLEYLKQLTFHLKAMAFDVNIDAWDDRKLRSSNNWLNEILKAINEASDIILLVSAAFLSSEFIRRTELPSALNNAETKGVRIHSVILSPCRFNKVKSISAFQAPNNPDKPMSACTFHEQELIWDKLCNDIEAFLEGI